MQDTFLKSVILLSTVFGIFSCSHNEVFFSYRSFENAEWNRNDTVVFCVNIEDNSQSYDVMLEIRNLNSYPFSNIWLFVDYRMPDGTSRSDTISADLADVYGKWYGKGMSLYNLSIPYETSVLFPDTGIHTYSIRQGMRDNPLRGISDIGLKVSKKSVE